MHAPYQSTALLLAGGQGRRLRPSLPDCPKPLAPVQGRPFVEWVILALRRQGIRRILFCTGYMAENFEAHFGDGRDWDVRITYSREAEPLGTAGALRHAARHAEGPSLLALNADSFCPLDLSRLARAHLARAAAATLWLVAEEDCSRYGSVALDDDGKVTAFREKAAGAGPGLINAGIYLIDRTVLEALPDGRPVSLETEVLPALIGKGLFGVVGPGPFLDIGTPQSYSRAESFLAQAGLS